MPLALDNENRLITKLSICKSSVDEHLLTFKQLSAIDLMRWNGRILAMLNEDERSALVCLSETSRKHGYLVCLINDAVFPHERYNVARLDDDDILRLAEHTNVRVSIECFLDSQ